MQKPVIITDIDGVAIKWQSGLPYFCAKNGLNTDGALASNMSENYISPAEIFGVNSSIASKLMYQYNTSKFIRYLQPYQDALEFINKHKEDYNFVAITALAADDHAIMNRLFNLNSLFPGAFVDVMSCNFGESKTKLFERAKSKYSDIVCFIDDLAHNLEDAHQVFGDTVPLYHLKRGARTPPNLKQYRTIYSMNEITL